MKTSLTLKTSLQLTLLAASAVMLAACGGGGGDPATPATPTSPASAASASAPGGLYVGYYAEDPATNPEDPTLGAYVLNLPNTDASFSGSMFFTYVGCQSSNVGNVSGTKAGAGLSGAWSGVLDGTAQSGSYAGSYQPATLSYSGTYSVAGGKQFMDLRPCTQYWIGPNGIWEMFALEAKLPAGFDASVNVRTITWPSVAGARLTLVYLLDPVMARSSGNPVVWQTLVQTGFGVSIPDAVVLQPGKEYVVVVAVANGAFQRLAFASRTITGP